MKRIFLALLVLIVFAQISQAQFTVSIECSAGQQDTVKLCKNAVTRFIARVTGSNPDSCYYRWYMGDGSIKENVGLDTVQFAYKSTGGFYLWLKVVNENDSVLYTRRYIKVPMDPNFDGTKSNVEERTICHTDTVGLTGKAEPVKWTYTPIVTRTEPVPLAICDLYPAAKSNILIESPRDNSFLDDPSLLQNITINFEHSRAQNLQITLTCPDGKYVILKEFGGDTVLLGEPIMADNFVSGLGYNYTWANNGSMLMNDATTATISSNIVYLPETSFSNLQGCPITGEWQLTMKDNVARNNGFLFHWTLNFASQFFEPLWTMQYSYPLNTGIWGGDSIAYNNVSYAQAYPKQYGNNEFTFTISDNLGCTHDTTVIVKVSKPTFTPEDPAEGTIDDPVEFKSTTDWGTSYTWNFGEGDLLDEIIGNAEYTYIKKGVYKVVLFAKSIQGCTDVSDTTAITITVPKSSMEEVNYFTPNGDGKNDVFKLKFEAKTIYQLEGYIFNRWGRKVCTWTSPTEAEEGWDGTIRNDGGAKAAPGTYFYYVKAVGKDDVSYEMKGTLYLYRDK